MEKLSHLLSLHRESVGEPGCERRQFDLAACALSHCAMLLPSWIIELILQSSVYNPRRDASIKKF